MAAHLRGGTGTGQGIGHALKSGGLLGNHVKVGEDRPASDLVLINRAGESKSPYVRGHASNPVAWQLWGDETIALAKKTNRLLFVSIGYSACHWCHVMEKESFEHEDVAAILNSAFIPIKIDREERPDVDRIYMNFVQATTGSGGWPLNVFVTPELEPVFGGTYWPGPNTHTPSYEDQVDFLGILNKLSTVWKEQEDRCRLDASQILKQLKDFAAEGTYGDKTSGGSDGLDLELLEEAMQHFASTFDSQHGGFGSAPKFPTPAKLSFLLRLSQYPKEVLDVAGASECLAAQEMAITTLRKMARGGIHDHIGNGFARYSVTTDWSLPHFEKMLYDNAQLLHVYLDAFLLSRDAELLGVVYDIAAYLTTNLANSQGGFYSSEDADSFYRSSDTETREGAYYVWTKREFENVLAAHTEPILSAFYNVSTHGNVLPENDAHDEFIDQNVLAVISTPATLAAQFGMKEEEIVRVIKEGKSKLRGQREKERVRPALDDKIVTSWNGIAIGALARTGAVIEGFDPDRAAKYLEAALKTARFLRTEMYDEGTKTLWRVWREGRGDTRGFADDYAFLIEGLLDLYECTFKEEWLEWADELMASQISQFHDSRSGGFFSTTSAAPHLILRLKDGMDTSEPSTNGISASNLWRLSFLLEDDTYADKARETARAFESEMLQYPWLFGSFMPGLVAGCLRGKGVVIVAAQGAEGHEAAPLDAEGTQKVREWQGRARGALGSVVVLKKGPSWLRTRNPLLRDLKPAEGAKSRVFICEQGRCREEGVEGMVSEMDGLGV